jgi:hypothetical protein
MTRRLTNQDAFDGAMLSLLNQGHSSATASGQARYHGPRGKSAIGALIPEALYVASMEGKKVRHWLAAPGSEYDGLRERLGGVTPSLLDELQDLHDRIGACMPSLYRHLAVDGAQRIAHSFKLSMSLVRRCAAYQHLRGPRIYTMEEVRAIAAARHAVEVARAAELAAARTVEAARAAELAAARTVEVARAAELAVASMPNMAATPAPELIAAPTPELLAVASVPQLAAAPMPALAVAPAPELAATQTPDLAVVPVPMLAAAAPTPAPAPVQLAQRPPQDDLDLIARGIARAIAAARPRSA